MKKWLLVPRTTISVLAVYLVVFIMRTELWSTAKRDSIPKVTLCTSVFATPSTPAVIGVLVDP